MTRQEKAEAMVPFFNRIGAHARELDSMRAITFVMLGVVLLLAWAAYHPGLSGDFLFDDFANLPALGDFGRIDNAATFWRYITSGSADPTGRPLALLSFLIDANNWPADPHPFKRTGVLLHLLNGCVLYGLLAQLGRFVGGTDRQQKFAAVLGAALWMLHPLFVSTTLYIVQREAMLPATFVLLGLSGYVRGRELASRGRFAGVVLAAASIVTGTLLGVLSKANGALLPLLAWIIDAMLLRQHRVTHPGTRRSFAVVRASLLVAPSVLLFAYLIYKAWSGMTHGILAERPWTLGERLLTEPRIVIEYLGLLWIPRPYSSGLFNDAISVSTGLFSPLSTLACIAAIIGLIGLAFASRKRHPALAAALLFYFAGQLLESTAIPLELYFEHRNYLPALLMFWPLGLWLCEDNRVPLSPVNVANESRTIRLGWLRSLLAIVLPLGLAGLTFLRADLWGNRDDQALLWAEKNPHSPRAQAYAAQVESAQGHKAAAIARLERALSEHPDEIQLALNLIGMKCDAGALTDEDIARAERALRTTLNVGRLGYEWFERGLPAAQEQRCRGLDLTTIESLVAAAWDNPSVRATYGRRQDLLNLRARVALMQRQADQALDLFNAALDEDPRPGVGLQQAALLASAGFPALALKHLDHLEDVWKPPTRPAFDMPEIHAWLLSRQGYWQHEIAHLRGVIADDLKHQAPQSSNPPAVP